MAQRNKMDTNSDNFVPNKPTQNLFQPISNTQEMEDDDNVQDQREIVSPKQRIETPLKEETKETISSKLDYSQNTWIYMVDFYLKMNNNEIVETYITLFIDKMTDKYLINPEQKKIFRNKLHEIFKDLKGILNDIKERLHLWEVEFLKNYHDAPTFTKAIIDFFEMGIGKQLKEIRKAPFCDQNNLLDLANAIKNNSLKNHVIQKINQFFAEDYPNFQFEFNKIHAMRKAFFNIAQNNIGSDGVRQEFLSDVTRFFNVVIPNILRCIRRFGGPGYCFGAAAGLVSLDDKKKIWFFETIRKMVECNTEVELMTLQSDIEQFYALVVPLQFPQKYCSTDTAESKQQDGVEKMTLLKTTQVENSFFTCPDHFGLKVRLECLQQKSLFLTGNGHSIGIFSKRNESGRVTPQLWDANFSTLGAKELPANNLEVFAATNRSLSFRLFDEPSSPIGNTSVNLDLQPLSVLMQVVGKK